MSYWFAACAPARLTAGIQSWLGDLISKAAREKTVRDLYEACGLDTYPTTAAELLEFQQLSAAARLTAPLNGRCARRSGLLTGQFGAHKAGTLRGRRT